MANLLKGGNISCINNLFLCTSSNECLAANGYWWSNNTCRDVEENTTNNTVPVANAGVDQNITTTSTVTLNGSSSSDADSDLLPYNWSITSKPAGSSATLSSTTTASPTFTADVDGSYVVQLIVNDGKVNSVADTVTVTSSTANSVGAVMTLPLVTKLNNHRLRVGGCLV